VTDQPDLPIYEADPKPWYMSTTIRGGIASILSGLAGVILALSGLAPLETLVTSITAIGGGIEAIRGRLRAEQPIGG